MSRSGPVTLIIDRLGASGDGMATWEGRPIAVPFTAPGDRVEIEVQQRGKPAQGRLLQVLEPGPGRCSPPCALAGRCGGCEWLHLTPEAQRDAKIARVIGELERTAGLTRAQWTARPTLSPAPALAYRRRAALHVGRAGLHYFARRTHQAVPLEACPALVPALSTQLPALSRLLARAHGQVRELLLLAEGEATAAALVLPGPVKPAHAELAERLLPLGFQGIVLVPDPGTPVLVGDPVLKAAAVGAPEVTLRLRPDAFAQAHAEGNRLLVEAALELLAPRREERALELFGGNGNFTFGLARQVRELWMVEGSAVSLALARRAADDASVPNLRLFHGDVQRVVEGMAAEGQRFPLLLVDPPRTGFPGLAALAQALAVERLVYVACDPHALARDVQPLVAAGYRPQALQLLDLFPQTHHVEAVMGFSRG